MKTINTIARMSTLAKMLRKEGKTVGFVPTMGYLHDGHISLVKAARKHTDVVVISVFVNPAQFGPKEDLEKYPRDPKRDETMSAQAGVDIMFCPTAKEMYPDGYSTYVAVEGVSQVMCGASRPSHFRGVTTVVAKLFGIVKPDIAYFGQKDAQQAIIIKKMASDLDMDIEIKVMPTVRERDGLAMSSRNTYLSEAERRDAVVLNQALKRAESLVSAGEKKAAVIKEEIRKMIAETATAKIDYIALVDPQDLKELETIGKEALIALAVFFGRTRLIDNTIVHPRTFVEGNTCKGAGVKV